MKDEKSWVKVSGPERLSVEGPPFTDAIPFAKALIAAAPSRILWGTDFPHPTSSTCQMTGTLSICWE
jgi:predicted TIM-barrel fold metal-dependent hydrolase